MCGMCCFMEQKRGRKGRRTKKNGGLRNEDDDDDEKPSRPSPITQECVHLRVLPENNKFFYILSHAQLPRPCFSLQTFNANTHHTSINYFSDINKLILKYIKCYYISHHEQNKAVIITSWRGETAYTTVSREPVKPITAASHFPIHHSLKNLICIILSKGQSKI